MPAPTLIDIGINLVHDSYDHDRAEVIAAAKAAGVTRMIVTGSSLEVSRRAIALSRQWPGTLWCTAGVHPHHAGEFDEAGVPVLEALAREPEVVAVGGKVSAASILAGYRRGAFPMTLEGDSGPLTAWFSPDPRAVLSWPGMRVSRSLRRSMRRFDITYDLAFDQVLEGCADPSRPHGWITPDYLTAYRELFAAGHAHSVEVWRAGEIGGDVVER